METLKVLNKSGEVIDTIPAEIAHSKEKLKAYFEENGLAYDSKPKHKLTFYQADSFAKVASEIFHKNLKKKINEIDSTYFSPFIVNASFAVELFLKSLHQKLETKSYKTVANKHNLKELYFALPGKVQKSIETSVKVCLKASNRSEDSLDLKIRIKELANTFIDWRYMHEKDGLKVRSFQDFIILMNALRNSCLNLDWYKKT